MELRAKPPQLSPEQIAAASEGKSETLGIKFLEVPVIRPPGLSLEQIRGGSEGRSAQALGAKPPDTSPEEIRAASEGRPEGLFGKKASKSS